MSIGEELTARSRAASEYVQKVGWTQGTMQDGDGRVCATGAVMFCQPKTGDEHIVTAVLRHRDRAENWNDEPGRTDEEVVKALWQDITDAELAEVFGPQWEHVVALVRRAARLTPDEIVRPAAARAGGWGAARDAAWNAARAAARNASMDAAWNASMDAVRGAARGAAWNAARGAAAWNAARDAARGAVTRDLIGTHGYTQEHYDTLTRPWREVIGPVHPDDATTDGGEGK